MSSKEKGKRKGNGKKKIAMISVHSDPLAKLGGREAGGQNVYVKEVSKHLGRMGWTVDIFTRLTRRRTKKVRKIAKNVNVIYLKGGPRFHLSKEKLLEKLPEFLGSFLVYKESNKIDYNIVHGHYYDGGWVAMNMKRVLKIPMVQTFHSLGHVRFRALQNIEKDTDISDFEGRLKTEQEIMQKADKIIATNLPEKKDILHYYSFNLENKIEIIPCGVNFRRFRKIGKEKARERCGISPEDKALLYIGRIDSRKGIETIIRSLPDVKKETDKQNFNLKLIVIGGKIGKRGDREDIKEIERLKEIARSLGVEENVIFKGKRDQEKLRYYYSAADIFITAPYYEPFGMTTLETMRCGTPIIGSQVGGLPYLIKNRKTGLLFPPGNSSSLAKRIITLLNDGKLQEKIIANSEEMIREKYGWKTIAIDMAKVYNGLIE